MEHCARTCALAVCLLGGMLAATGQEAPTVIQVFMPNGDRPSRELRLQLAREDGRIETVYTDSKGKFTLSGSLRRDGGYIVTVEGDRRTFDTTTLSFRLLRSSVNYLPVFLKPYTGDKTPRAETVDLASLETEVPADARDAYQQGMKAVQEGKGEIAVGHFRRALALHPKYLRALSDLGVLYLRLERLDEAAEAFRRAIKLNRRFTYPRLNLGIVLIRQRRFQEAADNLEELLKANPRLEGVRAAYVDALIGLGKLAEAKATLLAAQGESNLSREDLMDVHYKLGVVHSREGRFAEAAAELEKAIGIDGGAANAHLLLGGALLELKRLPEAERELLRAYELGGSKMGNAQLLLGQLYLSQQKLEPALRAYEQYLKDVPEAPSAAKVKEVIERIRQVLAKK